MASLKREAPKRNNGKVPRCLLQTSKRHRETSAPIATITNAPFPPRFPRYMILFYFNNQKQALPGSGITNR